MGGEVKEILLAGIIASIFSFFGTPLLIRILANAGYGQMIRDDAQRAIIQNVALQLWVASQLSSPRLPLTCWRI